MPGDYPSQGYVLTQDDLVHPGGVQLTRIGLALVSQHVHLGRLHQCGRQALQLLGRRQQR